MSADIRVCVVGAGPSGQAVIWPICRFLESHDYTAAVKAGCRLAGFEVGPPRRPLLELDSESIATLGGLLARASVSVSVQ